MTEQEKQSLKFQADFLMEQGNIEYSESFLDEAQQLYDDALEIYQRIEYTEGIIIALIKKSITHRNQSQYEKSEVLCRKALELCTKTDHALLKVDALTELAVTFRKMGSYASALEYLQMAKTNLSDVNDIMRLERICLSLGFVHYRLGEIETSIEEYEKSITLCIQIGNRRGEGISYGNLAMVYKQIGDYTRSLDLYQQSLDIAREVGNKISEGLNLGNIGNVHFEFGNIEKSISFKKQAIEIAREIGDRRSEGIQLGNLGNLYNGVKQYDLAMTFAQQSLEIAQEIKNKRSEGIQTGNIGDLFYLQGNIGKAEEHFVQAIDICSTINFTLGIGVYSGSLALICALQNRFDESFDLLETTESHVQINPLEYGKFLCKKTHILVLNGQFALAAETLAKVRRIIEQNDFHSNLTVQHFVHEAETLLKQSQV